MESLPHRFETVVEDVRDYLRKLLPEGRVSDAKVSESRLGQLLLLRTKRLLAVFAFAGQDLEASYTSLYSGFKKYYLAQHGSWDKLDVSFVFCVPRGVDGLEGLSSRVETDVFFCRKFIVPVDDSVELSFARLPFLPLLPLSGKGMRPPSAQVLSAAMWRVGDSCEVSGNAPAAECRRDSGGLP